MYHPFPSWEHTHIRAISAKRSNQKQLSSSPTPALKTPRFLAYHPIDLDASECYAITQDLHRCDPATQDKHRPGDDGDVLWRCKSRDSWVSWRDPSLSYLQRHLNPHLSQMIQIQHSSAKKQPFSADIMEQLGPWRCQLGNIQAQNKLGSPRRLPHSAEMQPHTPKFLHSKIAWRVFNQQSLGMSYLVGYQVSMYQCWATRPLANSFASPISWITCRLMASASVTRPATKSLGQFVELQKFNKRVWRWFLNLCVNLFKVHYDFDATATDAGFGVASGLFFRHFAVFCWRLFDELAEETGQLQQLAF